MFDGSSETTAGFRSRRVEYLDFLESNPHVVPSGHLVYARADELLAVPFDAGGPKILGPSNRISVRLLKD